MHLAGFAPAFTLSLCDSEYARKPPMPIASVVRGHSEKLKDRDLFAEKSLTNCPLFDIDRLFGFDRLLTSDNFCSADNSSQTLKGKILTFSFTTATTKD